MMPSCKRSVSRFHNVSPQITRFLDIASQVDAPRDRQCYRDLHHKEEDRRASVAYKGKRDTGSRDQVQHNAYIKDHLNGDMRKDSRYHQRPVLIRRILRNEHQTVKQVQIQNKNDQASEYSEFLYYDRENHIVLCLGQPAQFLHTVSETFSEKSAAADRVQCLHDLISAAAAVLFGILPYKNPVDSKVHSHLCDIPKPQYADDGQYEHDHRCYDKRPSLGMRHKNDDPVNGENDDGCAQVVREYESYDRQSETGCHEQKYPGQPFYIASYPDDQHRHKGDNSNLRDLCRLELDSDLKPSSCPVTRTSDKTNCYHQNSRPDVNEPAEIPQDMIIYERNSHRDHDRRGCNYCLPPKEEHIISEFYFSRISAGTVKHDQAETGQK